MICAGVLGISTQASNRSGGFAPASGSCCTVAAPSPPRRRTPPPCRRRKRGMAEAERPSDGWTVLRRMQASLCARWTRSCPADVRGMSAASCIAHCIMHPVRPRAGAHQRDAPRAPGRDTGPAAARGLTACSAPYVPLCCAMVPTGVHGARVLWGASCVLVSCDVVVGIGTPPQRIILSSLRRKAQSP